MGDFTELPMPERLIVEHAGTYAVHDLTGQTIMTYAHLHNSALVVGVTRGYSAYRIAFFT
jgi:hypothetical protein